MTNFADFTTKHATTNTKDDGRFAPIPAGQYPVLIREAGERPYIATIGNKPDAMAAFLTLNPDTKPGVQAFAVMEILEGAHVKRRLYWSGPIKASSNDIGRGDKSASDVVDVTHREIHALFDRCGGGFGEEVVAKGMPAFDGRTLTCPVSQYKGADGQPRNGIQLLVSAKSPVGPVPMVSATNTAPVVTDDEPPF